MGKSYINISSIVLVVILINSVTYAVNARVLAGEGVATYKFTNVYEGIIKSRPSPSAGHEEPPSAQEFDLNVIDNSGPSPRGGGHDEPPPVQSFDWSGFKDSGPSHGGKGHDETPSSQNIDWTGVKDSGPSHGGIGHDEPPAQY